MMTDVPRITIGPPRYYQPISSKGPQGFTLGGRVGYQEVDGPLVVKAPPGKCVRHLAEPFR